MSNVTKSLCARGHIFSLIIRKLYQHVCLDEISHRFENGSCQVKTRSTGQNLEKTLCRYSRGHIFSLIIMKLGQNDFFDEILDKFENGSKTRSLCQMLEKPCAHS